MNKNISWKKSLLVSGTAMLLCGAMLAGTTFAWFTSTAASGKNTITAGTLDVELQYDVHGNGMWVSSTDPSAESYKIFDDSWQWEPGMLVASKPFRIANTGDRALKYEVTVKATQDDNHLSEVIKSAVVTADTDLNTYVPLAGDRETFWSGVKEFAPGTNVLTVNTNAEGTPDTDSYAELAVLLYWAPTERDNEYNAEEGKDALTATFVIDVYATQASVEAEKDGVDEHYDKGAPLGPAAATSESVEIYGAVYGGINEVNSLLQSAAAESDEEPALEMTELVYNEEEGTYDAGVIFKVDNPLALLPGILGVIALVNNAAFAQKDRLASIEVVGGTGAIQSALPSLLMGDGANLTDIKGITKFDDLVANPNLSDGPQVEFRETLREMDVTNLSLPMPSANWLLGPLFVWLETKMGGALDLSKFNTIDGETCNVIMTDITENPVTYAITFEFTTP